MWIDAHIHIYDITREGLSWPSAAEPGLYRKIDPEEFLSIATPCGIKRAIVIECAKEIENNIWTLEVLKNAPEICAVTGHINPCASDFEKVYERYAAYPKFRGLRIGSWSSLVDPERIAKNIAYLAGKRANVIDLLGRWNDIACMEEVIAQNPGVSFVINHMAGCPMDGNPPPADYVTFLSQMARYENVYMKVSGILCRSIATPPPGEVAYYAPVLEEIYDAFGQDRCLYGSDWPVITLQGSYEQAAGITTDFFRQKGPGVLDKIMGKNTERVYNITEAFQEVCSNING